MSTPTPAPGWYPDPAQHGVQRYWDGSAWTQSTQPIPGAIPTPPPAPGVPAYAPAAPAYAGPAYGSAPQVGFVEAIKLGFKKYATFEGRATRAEYWWWYLFTTLLIAPIYVLALIVVAATASTTSSLDSGSSTTTTSGAGSGAALLLFGLVALVGLVIIIPSISVMVRRLHDTGKSGWWYWISLIPFGSLVLLIFMLMESTPGPNSFGPPSRGAADLS